MIFNFIILVHPNFCFFFINIYQEEELDDLAGQVQMLEAAKVRLEMSIEQMRKENRRESSQRDEELEEVRITAQKKVKGIF